MLLDEGAVGRGAFGDEGGVVGEELTPLLAFSGDLEGLWEGSWLTGWGF